MTEQINELFIAWLKTDAGRLISFETDARKKLQETFTAGYQAACATSTDLTTLSILEAAATAPDSPYNNSILCLENLHKECDDSACQCACHAV